MPRPLLPPDGIWIPAGLLYDPTLPPVVRDTWVRLRGLAWGQTETPPLSIHQICELLGMSQSTLYGHMLILRDRAACSWRAAGSKTLIVSFAACPGDLSRNLEKPTLLESSSTDSKKPGRRGRTAAKTGDPPPAAVAVYREIAQRFPDKSTWPLIFQKVGNHSENLERWAATVRGWIAAGYSKVNVAGMLDWFEQGRTSRENQPSGRASQRRRGPDDPAAAEALRRSIEDQERARHAQNR
jgi:hypothetical protein